MKRLLILFLLLPVFVDAQIFEAAQNKDDKNYYLRWYAEVKLTYADFKLQKKQKTDTVVAGYRSPITYTDNTGKVVDTFIDDSNAKGLFDYLAFKGYEFDFNYDFFANDTGATSAVDIYPVYYRLGDNVYYTVHAVFFPNQSYMKYRTEEVLNHEQNHFDICEIYARKLKKYFKNNLKKANYDRIDHIVDSFRKEELKTQHQFDDAGLADYWKKNNHIRSNADWEKKIHIQLDALKNYASTEGSIMDGIITLK